MRALPALVVVLAAAACSREEVRVYEVAKQARPAAAKAHASRTVPAQGLAWSLPEGWREAPSSGMRLATFQAGSAEVSVVSLPGSAGGDLANLNRWRGQMGLPPTDEAGMARQSKRLSSAAGELLLFDLAAGGQRTMAARLSSGGRTWFFKMTGADGAVAEAASAFETFLGSLSFGAS